MRIGGLASGMDIDSIVEGLLKTERLPLNKVEKKLQNLEWKRDDYRSMNTLLLNFSKEVSSMKHTSNYRVYSVASSDSSKVTATASNAANVGSTTISNVTQLATSASFIGGSTNLQGQTGDYSLAAFAGSQLTINGETFTVEAEDTINKFVSKVNSSGAGVNMYYDYVTGQFSLSNKETGNGSIDLSGNLAETFGFLNNDGTLKVGASKVDGQNAILTINGIQTERTSNTFTENGVTYTIKNTFTNSVTTTVANNTDAMVDNIVSFVNKYNELIENVQSKLNEERNRNYGPLTDAERESLSEKQQENWENIAKKGLLRNDLTLSNVLSNMRLNFYGQVTNNKISTNYNHISKIGINTSPNYKDGGKLVIDEAKLRAALEADPQSVEQLFRGENGILSKVSDTLTSGMNEIKSKAGNENTTNQQFAIGKELDSLKKDKSKWETRLRQIETNLWSKFTRMEKLISSMNSQSTALSSYFS